MADRTLWLIVSAVVIGLVAAAAVLWVNLNAPGQTACGTAPSGPTPLGGAGWVAFGSPSEQTVGAYHWYNFTSESAGGGLSLDNLNFQVQTPNGSIVTPEVAWNLTVYDMYGSRIGTYSMTGPTAGTWTSGGASRFTSQQSFSLLATPNQLSGDKLAVIGTGTVSCGSPISGTTTAEIP